MCLILRPVYDEIRLCYLIVKGTKVPKVAHTSWFVNGRFKINTQNLGYHLAQSMHSVKVHWVKEWKKLKHLRSSAPNPIFFFLIFFSSYKD